MPAGEASLSLFELALAVVRFDKVPSRIVNANHGVIPREAPEASAACTKL
jgi:hypothetical protein